MRSWSRSNAQACIPCLARRQCWRDELLLQAHQTTNGNGTRANNGRKRPCACAKAKKFAAKADAFLDQGNLESARIQLISAVQNDPGNDELKERLDILYEALMLEPP